MIVLNSRRPMILAAAASIAMVNTAPAAQYFYGGFDGTNLGTPSNPVSGPAVSATNSTWYTDATGATGWGANVGLPNSNLTEVFLGGVAGASNYTLTLPSATTSVNVIVLQAANSGTNTLDFAHTGSNRLALATPSPAQTFGASIQQQGSANWNFTNTVGASAALRFSNSFSIAGSGSGNISIQMILSNTSSAVNATVNLTGGSTLQLGGLNLFGGTSGQSFTLTAGTVDFTNTRALGNASNQIRLNGGTIYSSNGSTLATYLGASAGTAGGVLIGGNVNFAGGSQAWSLGSALVTLTGNRTITTTNTSATGATIAGNIGESAAGFGLTVGATSTGKLTLTGTNAYTGTTTVAGGTLVLGANAQAPVLTGAGGANLQGSGKLLLSYNGTSPAAQVKTILDGGATGNFATSLIRATTLAAGQTIGYGDNGTDTVTLRITLPGDADLNGTVDFNDFLVLQNNFGQAGTRFDQGNFNYDGQTDFNDFLALQNSFGQSITGVPVTVTRAQVAAMTAFAQSVPEPASLGLIGFGAAALLRRRSPAK
ncbi:MAG: autotransporter [Phycisphaerales bacterium]|nr:autotransporter [Phycisphaerales bacterium]